MKKIGCGALLGIASLMSGAAALAVSDGALPVPALGDVQVAAAASFDAATGIYRYVYTVTNPTGSTGTIDDIYLDITRPGPAFGDEDALTVAYARNQIFSFRQMLSKAPDNQVNVVPVGIEVPSGWYGNIYARGAAAFNSIPVGDGGHKILPGENQGGFVVRSFGSPTLREITIIPVWIYVTISGEATQEEEQRAAEIEESIQVHRLTLGPSAAFPGSVVQWNELRDDLQRAIGLGWVIDAALGQALTTQLAAARAARDAFDGTLAKARLQVLLNTILASTAAQRRSELNDLVALNTQSLIANTQDTATPFEPKVSLDPLDISLPLGATYALTATAVNIANQDQPISDFPLRFEVTAGPNAPDTANRQTGVDGTALYSYQGLEVGTDTIVVREEGERPVVLGIVHVTWTGAPDLVVPVFSPPVIESQGGNTVVVQDITGNIGTLPSPATVTRYYISPTSPVDIRTAAVLGERTVPVLQPQDLGDGPLLTFTLPNGLARGTYYLAACADDELEVVELDETNNCSFNSVEGFASVIVPMQVSVGVACPTNSSGKIGKVNVRFHYRANGSSGSWSATKSTSCTDGSVVIGPQAMAGDLKLSPDAALEAGYSFTLPGNNLPFTATVSNSSVVFQLNCVSGAAPSPSTLTVPMPSNSYTLFGSEWVPTGDQQSVATYQGRITVPDVCSGSKVRFNKGGTFSATILLN